MKKSVEALLKPWISSIRRKFMEEWATVRQDKAILSTIAHENQRLGWAGKKLLTDAQEQSLAWKVLLGRLDEKLEKYLVQPSLRILSATLIVRPAVPYVVRIGGLVVEGTAEAMTVIQSEAVYRCESRIAGRDVMVAVKTFPKLVTHPFYQYGRMTS